MTKDVYITVDQNSIGDIQVSIDSNGSGYRLLGPKYDGTGYRITRRKLNRRDAVTIKTYLKKIPKDD